MESARTAIHKCVRPDFARQRLEWLASAARSTVVSTAVSDFDRDERTVLADYVRSVREERRVHNDTSVEAIVEVIMGLFEGLTNRSMSRADFCVEELQDVIAVVIRAALDA